MKNTLSILSCVALLFFLVGCSSLEKKPPSEGNSTPLLETYWKLTSLQGNPVTVLGEREPHVIFKAEQDRVQGHGGCNSFSGVLQAAKNNSYKVESLVSTEMACEGLKTEETFLKVLRSDLIYAAGKDILVLKDKDGKEVATLKAVYLR